MIALAVTGEQPAAEAAGRADREGGDELDFTTDIRIFVLGPKGIPEPVLGALNKEFVAALDDKSVRERLTGFGLDVTTARDNTPGPSQEAHRRLRRDLRQADHRARHQERVEQAPYSTLAPENSTTFFHFSVSDTMILPKSSGVPPIGSAAEIGELFLTSSVGQRLRSIVLVEEGDDVLRRARPGTPMPNQALAS